MAATNNDFRSRSVERFDSSRTPHSPGLRLEERVSVLRDRLEARADAQVAAQFRSAVVEARGHVKNWRAEKSVSVETARRYSQAVEKMRASGQRPEDSACKSTFEFRRAALVHQTRSDLKTALRDLDKSKRAGDRGDAGDAYERVRSGLDVLRKYPPSTGSREFDLERSSVYRGPSRASVEHSNSKRASLSELPADWQDRVQLHAREYDKSPLAVMALTGARPAEIRGTRVRQDEDHVIFEIQGAKVDADRGVKTRFISVQKSELEASQAGRDLQEWMGNREVRTIAHRGNVEAFRERISRASDRADLEQVSSYTYRHAAARELKNADVTKEEIADRLGQRSVRSQSVYG